MTLLQCRRCAARTHGIPHKTLGRICALCWEPLPGRTQNQKNGARKKARSSAAKNRRRSFEGFVTAHAGYPLGAGYPGGVPLRDDGESHRGAWYRMLREDPCSYCARPGGTVDHVDPCSGTTPLYGLYSWLNVTGACANCNGSKGAEKLLLWLAVRGISN